MADIGKKCDSYCYSRKIDLNLGNIDWPINDDTFKVSKFDEILLEKWQSAMANGHFRYNLDKVKTKIIPGKYKYVAQLNVRRATDRRPPASFSSVKENFNPERFNFLKVPSKEVLFELHPKDDLPDTEGCYSKCKAKHQVIINVSPIEMGHVLLVPFIDDSLPQILTVSSLALALDMVLLSTHRGFRIGWNSLGAFASVNHLHYHALYLDYPILADCMRVFHICNGIYEAIDIKSHGFAFQLHDHGSTDQLARLVCKVTSYFIDKEIPHNLIITRGESFQDSSKITLRVFLCPGKTFYGVKNFSDLLVSCFDIAGFLLIKGLCDDPFNCAALEKGGHMPIKEQEAYNSMTEEMANNILEKFSLTETEFNELKCNVRQLVSNR